MSLFKKSPKPVPTMNYSITVSVINESTVLTAAEVTAVVAALQIQVDRDFSPVWGPTAKLVVTTSRQAAKGSWWLVLLDDSDQAGALGYHDLTPEGLPMSSVFAKTDRDNGYSWTVTTSHELLEMLADPSVNRAVEVDDGGNALFYALEVGDPVEADNLGYKINGVLVSDFIFPDWWGGLTGNKYDMALRLSEPLEIAPGGYAAVYTPGSGWGTIGLDAKGAAEGEVPATHAGRDRLELRRSEPVESK